jgi:hypothetical protein
MKTRSLTFHTDPGHGWLEVSRADLDALGITNTISPYSYQKAARVYLEEDIDAARYMDAAKAAGYRLTIRDQYADPSPIRNLPSFTI